MALSCCCCCLQKKKNLKASESVSTLEELDETQEESESEKSSQSVGPPTEIDGTGIVYVYMCTNIVVFIYSKQLMTFNCLSPSLVPGSLLQSASDVNLKVSYMYM